MSLLSLHDPYPTSGVTRLFAGLGRRWREYRLMRAIEQVPGSVMKDLGYPAAERNHAR